MLLKIRNLCKSSVVPADFILAQKKELGRGGRGESEYPSSVKVVQNVLKTAFNFYTFLQKMLIPNKNEPQFIPCGNGFPNRCG